MNYEFQYPFFAWLYVIPACLVLYYFIFAIYNKLPRFFYPCNKLFDKEPTPLTPLKVRGFLIFASGIAAICFWIIAAMNPIRVNELQSVKEYGIDITIVLDVSSSMSQDDFSPTRIKAAKRITKQFIESRQNDRIGIVIFAGDAFVQCPQTTEYTAALEILKSLRAGMVVPDRTAIGLALSVGASRLLESKVKNRIMILITDGEDNQLGEIRPISAAKAIRDLGIKVYTIGIGSRPRNFSEIQKVASLTGGKFYEARTEEQFYQYMKEIDDLEKSFLRRKRYQVVKEFNQKFILYGFLLLLTGLALDKIIWPVRL